MTEVADSAVLSMLRQMDERLARMEDRLIGLERQLASVTARLDALPSRESPRVVPMPHRM